MREILQLLTNMLPYILGSLPFILIFRAVRVRAMKKIGIKTTALHEIGVICFAIFIVGLASQAVIPKMELGDAGFTVVNDGSGEINLIPFRVIPDTYRTAFVEGRMSLLLINFIGNIVIFMPIGFLVPLLWNNVSFKRATLIGFLSSLFIEVCQIPQARSTDVDDLWLNTLGCILGYAVYHAVKKVSPRIVGKFKTVKIKNE